MSLLNASKEYAHANQSRNQERINQSLDNLLNEYKVFLENNIFTKVNAAERDFSNPFMNDISPSSENAVIPCMMNCAVTFYNLACYNVKNNQLERAQIWCELANLLPEEFLQFHKPLLTKLREDIITMITHNNSQPNDDASQLRSLVKDLFKKVREAGKSPGPDFFKQSSPPPSELAHLEKMVNALVTNPSSANAKRIMDTLAILEISLKSKNVLNDPIKNILSDIKECVDRIYPFNKYHPK